MAFIKCQYTNDYLLTFHITEKPQKPYGSGVILRLDTKLSYDNTIYNLSILFAVHLDSATLHLGRAFAL